MLGDEQTVGMHKVHVGDVAQRVGAIDMLMPDVNANEIDSRMVACVLQQVVAGATTEIDVKRQAKVHLGVESRLDKGKFV